MDENNHKRHRLTSVCDVCKKRKVKCDRGQHCVKRTISHLCTCKNSNTNLVSNDNPPQNSGTEIPQTNVGRTTKEEQDKSQNYYGYNLGNDVDRSPINIVSTTENKNSHSLVLAISNAQPSTAAYFVLQMVKDKVKEI